MTGSVAILGLGLMGSSIGLALKQRGFKGEVRGYARRAETCAKALELNVVDFASADIGEAVRGADLAVLCVPVLTIPKLTEAALPHLKSGAVVTDVGSTKSELQQIMRELFAGSDAFFVGSHPIAGSEKTGVEAGFADLYEGRLTVVVPNPDAPAQAADKVRMLWEACGSFVQEMAADTHDSIIARTSHLPHLVASTLVLAVARSEHYAEFCGTGFRDTTRVASGSPEMWRDIVSTNSTAIIREAHALKRELDGLIGLLEAGDPDRIEAWLREAADKRNAILEKPIR